MPAALDGGLGELRQPAALGRGHIAYRKHSVLARHAQVGPTRILPSGPCGNPQPDTSARTFTPDDHTVAAVGTSCPSLSTT